MNINTQSDPEVFRNHAGLMASSGLAVVPLARDRTPLVAGFNKWSRRPSERTVAAWSDKYANANIGILPGLSGLLVIDNDDDEHDQIVEELCGPTPLRVRSNRGRHRYYAKPCERLPGNLRMFGLHVDVKAGNSIVIAPPSIHQSGKTYQLEDADWSVLTRLPRPDVDRLRKYIDGQKKKNNGAGDKREMRDGSRGQWLNDHLCSHAAYCDDFAELLDVARTANMNFTNRGHAPLDADQVVLRAKKVWKDFESGKLQKWIGKAGIAKARKTDILDLTRINPKGAPDAFMLLAILKLEHGARSRRGETFAITPQSMERDQVIPGWEWKRYMRARDLLIEAKLLKKVADRKITARGRIGSQYILPGARDGLDEQK